VIISFSSRTLRHHHHHYKKPCQTKVENWLTFSYICSFGALTILRSCIMMILRDKRHPQLIHSFMYYSWGIPTHQFVWWMNEWIPYMAAIPKCPCSGFIWLLSFNCHFVIQQGWEFWNSMHESSQFSLPFIFFILCPYRFGESLSPLGFITPLR